ncbi:MAG: hypothetical protein J0J15_09900 [Mesorhizobium sp.]|nr:hypothetical protein [Mesorhizobium sp.]
MGSFDPSRFHVHVQRSGNRLSGRSGKTLGSDRLCEAQGTCRLKICCGKAVGGGRPGGIATGRCACVGRRGGLVLLAGGVEVLQTGQERQPVAQRRFLCRAGIGICMPTACPVMAVAGKFPFAARAIAADDGVLP